MATLTLLLGLSAVLFGGYWLARRHDFLATASSAEGRVVANRREEWSSQSSGSSASRHAYRAIVQFTDRAGHHVTHPDFFAFSPSSFSVGQTVNVLYDPASPEHAWIDRGEKENYLLVAFCGAGALLFAAGVRALRRDSASRGTV
jgi:hypothetical protein